MFFSRLSLYLYIPANQITLYDNIGLMKNTCYIFLIVCLNLECLVSYGADTLAVLSSVKGADMTVYELYMQYRNTDRKLAMQYLDTFMNGVSDSRSNEVIAELCEELSDWYGYNMFLYSKAISYRERAIDVYIAQGNTYKTAVARYELAKLWLNTDQYDKSLKASVSALEIFQKCNDTEYILECYNMLGILYYLCEEFETSNAYFRKYAEGARTLKDSTKLLLAINNSSLYASNIKKDTTKTRQLLKESIRLARLVNDSTYLFSMYFNLANNYMANGETGHAMSILEMSDKIARNIKEKGRNAYMKGAYYLHKGEYEKAVSALSASVGYLKQGELDKDCKKSLLALQYAYKCIGDYISAYNAVIEYYDIDKKTVGKEIDLFKAQNEILQREKQKEKYREMMLRIVIAVFVGFVLIVTFFVVWYHFKKKAIYIKEKEKELESKNNVMEMKRMQQYQLDMLGRSVISRLEALSEKMENEELSKAIQDICVELRNSKDDNDWKEITHFIPEFSSEFYNKLIKDYPNLTINERRLCVLLNMNMSTKEISAITKQSLHSINIARARLRKKLSFNNREETFSQFFSKYN